MSLIEEEGLVAVCSCEPTRCDEERIAPEDAFEIRGNSERFVVWLQGALGLPVRTTAKGGAIYLGERSFGHVPIGFVFVPRPRQALESGELERRAYEASVHVLVVVCFHPDDIPAPAPSRAGPRELEWLALADAHVSNHEVTLDLAGLWLKHAPQSASGTVLWPRFLWVAHPAQRVFWFRGQAIDLSARSYQRQLLTALLQQPGRWWGTSELARLLWSGDYGRRGVRPASLVQRLQQTKSDLAKSLALLFPSHEVIETTRAQDGEEGSYRIDVQPHQVHWLSEPTE